MSSLTLSLPRVPLIDFTLSNARRFYSSMGNPTGVTGLSKLRVLGVSREAIEWFRSYLSDRVQRVRIGCEVSDPRQVAHGVPQELILGPALFKDVRAHCYCAFFRPCHAHVMHRRPRR